MSGSIPEAPKKRRRRPLRSPFVVTVAAGAAAGVVALLACGTSHQSNGLQGMEGGTISGGGPCSPIGATRPCHENLGKVGGVQQCFSGTQTCIAGEWTACGGSGVVQSSVSTLSVKGGGPLSSLSSQSQSSQSSLSVSAKGFKTEAINPASPLACDVASCTPSATCNPGVVCGKQDNGCGTAINCGPLAGACPGGQTCVSGTCIVNAGLPSPCIPESPLVGCPAGCGEASDGCGGAVSCPTACPSPPDGQPGPLNCVAHACPALACVPKTVAAACVGGLTCGEVSDGCGGSVTCPTVCGGATPQCVFNAAGTTSSCQAGQCPPNPGCGVAVCGDTSNLCGGVNVCGLCPEGKQCLAGVCVVACVPKTPATACVGGLTCGQVSDGCGGSVTCPTICSGAAPDCVFNAAGTMSACQPAQCPTNPGCGAAVCGITDNLCGGVNVCGTCPPNEQCVAGACVVECTPKTAAAVCVGGITCGELSDGCGGFVTCPTVCSGPTPKCAFNAAGTTSTCVSAATMCPADPGCGATVCGDKNNLCGGVDACGSCPADKQCIAGACVAECAPKTAATACVGGITCGQVSDGCGGTVTCPTVCSGATPDCVFNAGGTASSCMPAQCPTNPGCGAAVCGATSDLCGFLNSCGTCAEGAQCVAGACVVACTPKTVATACVGGLTCGQVSDGCGGTVTCPTVCSGATPDCVFNAAGTMSSCKASTCLPNPGCGAAVCGDTSDLCGGVNACGFCPVGEQCIAGACVGPACTPLTPAVACGAAVCGQVSDGCNATVLCGALAGGCPAGKSCEAGACVANGCPAITTPAQKLAACTAAGVACGVLSDGCNSSFSCGGCAASQDCVNGQCTPSCTSTTCLAQGIACGHIDDGCGNDLNCGVCGVGTCGGGGVPGQCGAGACTTITNAVACTSNTCGVVSDGCTGTYNCPMVGGPACAAGLCIGGIGLPPGAFGDAGGGPPPGPNACAPGGTVMVGGPAGGTYTCAAGTSCVVDCTALGACHGNVTCNASGGGSCTIECGAANCTGNVTCNGAASCIIDCAGPASCLQNTTCTATTNCEISCALASCGHDVSCNSPDCDITCTGASCLHNTTETHPSGTGCIACDALSCLLGAKTCGGGLVCDTTAASCACTAAGGGGGGGAACAPGGTVVPGGTGTFTCAAGSSCVLDCSANHACNGPVIVQGGGTWTVNCSGNQSCSGAITYNGGPTFILNCTGNQSCGGAITSNATLNSEIGCLDNHSCQGAITCTSAACDTTCGGNHSCAGAVTETVGTGSGCITCNGGMACMGAKTCTGTTCNTNAASCPCTAGGGGGGSTICSADPCDPYCMEIDLGSSDGGLADGGGGGVVGVPFEAGQVPAGEISDLNHDCPDGGCGGVAVAGGTTISGVIYDPGVNVPLAGVTVFQPSGALTVFPANVACDTCASLASPSLNSAVTDVDGKFKLSVTGTTNIPIVIQTGRWRRQITVGAAAACPSCDTTAIAVGVDNPYAACTTASAPTCLWRLPRSGSAAGQTACAANCQSGAVAEGEIPLFAVIMGGAESLECDIAQFMGGTWEMGQATGTTRFRLFSEQGADTSPSTTASSTLYTGLTNASPYDAIMYGCPGGNGVNMSGPQQTNFKNWTEAGGKLFADHHANDYLLNSSVSGVAPFSTTSTWQNPSSPSGDRGLVTVVDAPHNLFKQWLTNRGAYGAPGVNIPQETTESLVVQPNAFLWLEDPTNTHSVSYSFDMGAGGVIAPGNPGVCGRVVSNAFHVETSRGNNNTFPGECALSASHGGAGINQTPDEDALEYLMFALTSCSILAIPPPAPSGCENYQFTPPTGANAFYACQMDTYCDPLVGGGTGECVPFAPGQTWAAPAPTPREGATQSGGVDLTVEQGCSVPEGGPYYQYVPICNRGTASVAAGTSVALSMVDFTAAPYNAAPFDPPGGCPTALQWGAPACHHVVPAGGLPGGSCMLVDLDTDCVPPLTAKPATDQLLFVNSDYAVPEDNLQPSALLSTQSAQAGCANNWGILSDNNNPPACSEESFTSTTSTFQYSASTCPVGTHGQWALLTYNATVGVGATALQTAEVLFQVATQPVSDAGTGPLTSFVTVADVKGVFGGNNLGDPAICAVAGPGATTPATACSNGNGNPTPPCCPKGIAQALELATPTGLGPAAGIVADNNTDLTLKITINPSPDGTQTATVQNWQVSFDCVPSE